MAMQVLSIIQMAGSNFLVIHIFIVLPFSYYSTGVSNLLLYSGADLGFTARRITLKLNL